MTTRALAGLRIVELAEIWAGPFGCSLLGDLGADVIKLESYPRNSITRPLVPDARVADGPGPVYERVNNHHHGNRNKRNIAVNLRDDAGAAILRRLIGWGDIVVESFSAGTLERMGFGWDVVSAINHRASLISLPGWGQAGPYQGYTMIGSGFDAMVGHASVRGYPGAPTEELISITHSDATVPLMLAFAVLTVVQQRDRSGRGYNVDMAQVEALAYELPGLMAEWSLTGRSPARIGNTDRHLVPYGCYRASGDDEWVNISCENDAQWHALARAMGHPEWADDVHPWASAVGRLRDRSAVDAVVAAFALTSDSYAIADRVQAEGGVAAPAVAPEQVLLSPQLHAREWFQTVAHPYLGERLLGGFLWNVQPDAPSWDRRCGLLGEHNSEVLTELGYDARAIGDLAERNVIGDRYPPPTPRST
ncbi:MAG: CoA transferase [Chloroflexi bacterium]|nr:CoA transferase [Chloroflexota bacterium]